MPTAWASTNNGNNILQNVTLGGTSGLTLGDQVGSSFGGYTNIVGTLTNGVGANVQHRLQQHDQLHRQHHA